MQVENVARICFASRGALQGQRHLAVSNGLLGQVIVYDEHVTARIRSGSRLAIFAVVQEVFANCSARHRSDVLQRCRIRSRSGNNNGVLHGAVTLEGLADICNRGCLLADCNINADHVLTLLVDDGVHRNRSLTGLTVANDKFTLATSNRNHGVNSQDTRLHGLMNRLTGDNARSLEFNGAIAFSLNGALAINRHTEGVHYAAEHFLARRNLNDTTRCFNLIVFLDCGDIAQQNGAHFVFFKVLSQAEYGLTIRPDEFQKFACHGVFQSIDTRNTVADRDNGTYFTRLNAGIQLVELLTQSIVDGLCGDFSH